MLTRARLLIPALVLALSACGGGDDAASTSPDPAHDRPVRKGASADATEPVPDEPLAFDVEPITGTDSVDTSVKVTTEDGSKVKLKKLLRDPSVLLYGTAAVRGRNERAATRVFLRPLARSAAHAGFRVVVLFEQGTSDEDVAAYFEKRYLPPSVRYAVDHAGDFAEASGWEARTAALLTADGTVGQLFEPTAEWDERVGFSPVATSDILARAWQMPDEGPEVDDATVQAATDLVVATLTGADADPAAVTATVDHPTWVSLFRPGDIVRLRGSSSKQALGDALVEATTAALASAGDDEASWRADATKIRVQVDLTGAPGPVVTTGEKSLWYLVEPGVHGVTVTKGDATATMLPSEPVSMGHLTPRVRARKDKHRRMFGRLCKDAKLRGDCWQQDDVTITRFRSTSFGLVEPGKPAVRLFRGNVLWEGEPTEQQVLDSIKWGGLWLVNTVQEDGKFDYEYYPNKDEGSRGYNIVRHAGSVYGLFEMWELAGEEPHLAADRDRYIAAAGASMGYVYEGLKPPPAAREGRICLLDKRGGCDSGSAALTLLTFLVRPAPEEIPAEHREACYREDDAALMEGLGLTLLDMIDDKGKVWRRYRDAMTQDRVVKEPLYYPGESMLALVRFYEATGDERWLDGARRIAQRQMDWYERKRMQNPDHWVMQALYRLWLIDKDDRYAQNAYAMGTHYASEQYGDGAHYGPVWTPWPDYLGAYRRTNDTPRTTRAGSRSEALRAVTNLAWDRGDDATAYEEALLGAARHLMEQQYTERNGYWLPDLDRVHGAYPMGVVDNHVRIDNNQHALVGMVGALHVIRKRAGTLEH